MICADKKACISIGTAHYIKKFSFYLSLCHFFAVGIFHFTI